MTRRGLRRRVSPPAVGLAVALGIGLLAGELDQTAFTTMLPTVVDQLAASDRLAWVNTAYVVAAVVGMPVFGRVADRAGRRAAFGSALSVLIIGSAIGALADSIVPMIIARTVQGLGAGSLYVLIQVVVADRVAPRGRARALAVIDAVFAGAALAGPLLGGVLAHGDRWRWLFWINLPMGALALVAVVLGGRRAPGQSSTTSSAAIRRAPVAEATGGSVIRRLALIGVAAMIIGAAVFGVVNYVPTYLQWQLRFAPVPAGAMMIIFVVGMGGATLVAAEALRRTSWCRGIAVAGSCVVAVSLAGIAAFGTGAGWLGVGWCLFGLGVGAGLCWETVTVMAQAIAEPGSIGSVTSWCGFGKEAGVALGTVVVGTRFMGESVDPAVGAWVLAVVAIVAGVLLALVGPVRLPALPPTGSAQRDAAVAAPARSS